MAPTVRLAGLVALAGAAGLVLPPSVIGALWVLLFVLAVIDVQFIRESPSATFTVSPMARLVPSPFRLQLTPSDATRRARSITLRQPIGADLRVEPNIASAMVLDATITASRRGIHQLAPPAVRLIGPLGLASMVHELPGAPKIVVHPDVPTAHRLVLAARRGLLQVDGRNRGPLGIGTEFEAVREYRPDDDVRQINWLATARTGRAMSTVYRQEDDRDLLIVVETGRLTAGSFAGGLDGVASESLGDGLRPEERERRKPSDLSATARLDTLFDAVVALALVADEVGDRVGFLAYDAEERVRLHPKRRGGQGIVHAVLSLGPRLVEPDHSQVALRLPALRRSVVVMLVELLDEANAHGLVASVARLQASHDVIVAVANDPEVLDARTAPQHSLRIAAADLLTDRDALIARLTGTGAVVVSGRPHMLAATATRAYLSRRSGRRPKVHTRAQ